MKNLYDTLRAKEAQLAQLEDEIDALRIAAKILAEESATSIKKSPKKQRGANLLAAALTQPQMIREVLLEKGESLHVEKIAERLKEKFGVKLKPLYLTSIIYRLMKKGRLFRKDGPNTFGLLEWPTSHQRASVNDGLRVQ